MHEAPATTRVETHVKQKIYVLLSQEDNKYNLKEILVYTLERT